MRGDPSATETTSAIRAGTATETVVRAHVGTEEGWRILQWRICDITFPAPRRLASRSSEP